MKPEQETTADLVEATDASEGRAQNVSVGSGSAWPRSPPADWRQDAQPRN